MTEAQYGIIDIKSELPPRRLLVVPHENKRLIVGYPAFGPNYFKNNTQEMQKKYRHPKTGETITFRAPTTSESISVAAYNFKDLAKEEIFNPRWLQAGYIVKTSKGVFANPPKQDGTIVSDEKELTQLLSKAKKVKVGNGHIYLGDFDFGFAEYETFQSDNQDYDTFTEGGLARILEHSESPAQNLRKITSLKNYKKGVKVYNFDSVKEPIVKIVGLNSDRDLDDTRLYVVGNYWNDDLGFACGVLDSREASASKI